MSNFWIDKFIDEKDIDREQILEVEGPVYGANFIPVQAVIDAVKSAPKSEYDKIKQTLIAIDFKNGDVLHFIRHLAQAIAL